jgi:hypothetical protein
MSDTKTKVDEILASLKTQRDELALKIHLGKAEARDEWDRLEKKLAELRRQAGPVKGVAAETARNVGSAIDLAGEEIKKGYDRIRKMLAS